MNNMNFSFGCVPHTNLSYDLRKLRYNNKSIQYIKLCDYFYGVFAFFLKPESSPFIELEKGQIFCENNPLCVPRKNTIHIGPHGGV